MVARNARWMLAGIALALVLVAALAFTFLQRERAVAAELDARRAEQAARALAEAKLERPAAPEASAVRAAEQRVEVAGRTLSVHVVEPAGAAVVDAKLALFRAAELLALATTDARGIASFDAREGVAQYALFAPGWALARGEIGLAAGEPSLTLVEGEVIAGSVRLDGAIPNPGIELTFDDTDRSLGLGVLPRSVRIALRAERGNFDGMIARTRADGTFAFRGLPAAVSGRLQWRGPYFLEAANPGLGPQLWVATPRRDLELKLISGFELRLRVVDSSGTPVPGAPVTVITERKRTDGSSGGRTSQTADSEGRYSTSLLRVESETLTVAVEVALVGGAGLRNYPVDLPAVPRGVIDLGDLSTDAAREVSVLVRDESDTPVEGATVGPLPWRMPPKERTDASGRIQVRIGANDREIAAVAMGFLAARVAVPANSRELTVTLRKATLLEFELSPAPEARRDLSLLLSGPATMFVGQDDEGPGTPQGEGRYSMDADGSTTKCTTKPEKDGHWRIRGLVAGESMHAALRATDGPDLWTGEIAPLAAGEHRVVPMRLDAEAKSLRVRVLGPDGKPQPHASVFVGDGRNGVRSQGRDVDANGEIELDSLFGDRCTLQAQAPGFPSKLVVLHPIPAGTFEITLDTPRSIEVELVTPAGTLFEEKAQVRVRNGVVSVETSTPISPGRYRLEHLPPTEVLIEVNGPNSTVNQLHDARVPFARVVVGESGTIRVSMREPDNAADSVWSIAVAKPGGADFMRAEIYFNEQGDAHETFPGLALAAHDVWLELRSPDDANTWSRVGQPTKVVLDSANAAAELELRL